MKEINYLDHVHKLAKGEYQNLPAHLRAYVASKHVLLLVSRVKRLELLVSNRGNPL